MKVPFIGISFTAFVIVLLIGMVIALKFPDNIVTSNINKAVQAV